jgi:hypothetical protein
MAEGKQHALAIGYTKMSAQDIKSINKGIGVDNMHYLNDGLWKVCSPFSLCTLRACVLVLKDSHGFIKLARVSWDSKHLT